MRSIADPVRWTFGTWTLVALTGFNAAVWALPLAANPKAHMTAVGAYWFWWYDDLPWVALALSVVVPIAGWATGAWRASSRRRVMVFISMICLCAFLPWGCMAGAGM